MKNLNESSLIARIWRGWTTAENACAFEHKLENEIFPAFARKNMKGFKGAQLLKNQHGNEIEFTTIMWFDSLLSLKNFAGEDYEAAHIDADVEPLMLRYDTRSAHHFVSYSNFNNGGECAHKASSFQLRMWL